MPVCCGLFNPSRTEGCPPPSAQPSRRQQKRNPEKNHGIFGGEKRASPAPHPGGPGKDPLSAQGGEVRTRRTRCTRSASRNRRSLGMGPDDLPGALPSPSAPVPQPPARSGPARCGADAAGRSPGPPGGAPRLRRALEGPGRRQERPRSAPELEITASVGGVRGPAGPGQVCR